MGIYLNHHIHLSLKLYSEICNEHHIKSTLLFVLSSETLCDLALSNSTPTLLQYASTLVDCYWPLNACGHLGIPRLWCPLRKLSTHLFIKLVTEKQYSCIR